MYQDSNRDPLGLLHMILWLSRPAIGLLLLLIFGGGLSGCAANPGPAQIEAAAAGEQVEIAIDSQPGQIAISIHDPSGIGQAEFAHTGGEFPERVVYQLDLKALEQVVLAYGDTRVEAALSSQPGQPVSQNLASGAGTPGVDILEPGNPYWLEIAIVPQDGAETTIPLQSGYIQVEPPPDFYRTQPERWSLSWVDFFR